MARWMVIQCAACQARFRVADEKVADRGVRARCKKCGAVFLVQREAEASAPETEAPAAQPSAEAAPRPGPVGVDPFFADSGVLSPTTGVRANPLMAAKPDPFGDLIPAVRPPSGSWPNPLAPVPDLFGDLALAPPPESQPAEARSDDLGDLSPQTRVAPPGPPPSAPNPAAFDDGPDPFGLPASPPTPCPGPPALAPKPDPFAGPTAAPAAPSLLPDLNSFEFSAPHEDEGPALSAEQAVESIDRPAERVPQVPAAASPPALDGPASPPARAGPDSWGSGPKPLPSSMSRAPAQAAAGRAGTPGGARRPRRRRSAVGSLVNAAAVSAAAAAAIVLALRNPPPGGQRVSRPADVLRLLAGRPSGELVADQLRGGAYLTAAGRSLLVVRGRIVNRGSTPKGPIEVAAEVSRGAGAALRQTARAGALPTPEELWSLDSPAALAQLSARLDQKAERLAPGGSAPFAVVFFECPEDLAEHELQLSLRETPAPLGASPPAEAPPAGSSPQRESSARVPELPAVQAPERPLKLRSGQAAAQGVP